MQIIKPAPEPAAFEAPYWEGAKAGKLILQRAKGSDLFIFPPMIGAPPWCAGAELEWVTIGSDIIGTVYTYTIIHRAFHKAFVEEVPYAVALCNIAEAPGVHIMANVKDMAPQDVRIGLRLKMQWESLGEIVIPQWVAL